MSDRLEWTDWVEQTGEHTWANNETFIVECFIVYIYSDLANGRTRRQIILAITLLSKHIMPDHPLYLEDKTEFSIYENSKRHLSEKAVIRKHLGKFSN